MERFTIRFQAHHCSTPCPVCAQPHSLRRGPCVSLADTGEPVCRDCCKRQAPGMLALLDLAHVAENVGRKGRHMLTPPMESLLALARAAENYSGAQGRALAHAS
ncbi:MAG: hypothetical protein U0793_28580 [Gemmataceae bacterium]